MIKLARSTIFILLGMMLFIFIFNMFTREGFYENVTISGTGLSVGPITGTLTASAAPRTQVGSLGMQSIRTQQATDMPAAIAPTRGSVIGPTMGASSMDSCSDNSCGGDNCCDNGCN